ncbi:MAG: hypothetical protein LBQ79_11195 [Deltaproteobacteria bacterium]|nr:hypothetical protein [Deltaproteobacteria bacterium]
MISNTTTSTGLKVQCWLDRRKYHLGIKVLDKDMDNLNIMRETFHGEWNYTIQQN